jgi:hypothetical protein
MMQDFADIVAQVIDPWNARSGTAALAFLLYDLVRMTRPKCIVEYGTGYTTPFLARALIDNKSDYELEKLLLAEKCRKFLVALGQFEMGKKLSDLDPFAQKAILAWMNFGGQASCLDPRFYLEPYDPALVCFEDLAEDHSYCDNLMELLKTLGVSQVVKMHHEAKPFEKEALVDQSAFIDFAWNDSGLYRDFFEEFWPRLNPAGGVMIFHYGRQEYENDLTWIKARRSSENDLELVTMMETHKLVQCGCFILRKTSGCATNFAPRHLDGDALPEIVAAARELANS